MLNILAIKDLGGSSRILGHVTTDIFIPTLILAYNENFQRVAALGAWRKLAYKPVRKVKLHQHQCSTPHVHFHSS